MRNCMIALFALFVLAPAALGEDEARSEAVFPCLQKEEDRDRTLCVRLTDVPPPGPRTAAAKEAGITGSSVLQVGIDRSGFAFDVRIEKALGYGLDELCMATVKRNRWKPSTWNGVPTFCNQRITCAWTEKETETARVTKEKGSGAINRTKSSGSAGM